MTLNVKTKQNLEDGVKTLLKNLFEVWGKAL